MNVNQINANRILKIKKKNMQNQNVLTENGIKYENKFNNLQNHVMCLVW